jgi:hypothetical protein
MVFMARLAANEKADFERIRSKICNNLPLSPEELAQMIQLLAQGEGVNLTELIDIQDYLCLGKDYDFPNEKHLSKLLNINVKDFHDLKKRIKREAKHWLKKLGADNPDIGLNRKTGNIVLKNRSNGRTIETNLPLESFKKAD